MLKLDHCWFNVHNCLFHESTIDKIMHSKNTGVKRDPVRVHWGHTQSGSTMSRKFVNLPRNMTQNWVNLTPLFGKSAKSWSKLWVNFDAELSMSPVDPFPGHTDLGFFFVFFFFLECGAGLGIRSPTKVPLASRPNFTHWRQPRVLINSHVGVHKQ